MHDKYFRRNVDIAIIAIITIMMMSLVFGLHELVVGIAVFLFIGIIFAGAPPRR